MDSVKKIVKFAFIGTLLALTMGFQMHEKVRSPSSSYVPFANEVTHTFVTEVKKEFGFVSNGTGGSMPNDVEGITVGFIAFRKATVEEARILEITLTEKFLEIINSHEKIRPYLREYPFTSKGVDILISFYTKNKERQIENSISTVSQVKNIIYYDLHNPKNPTVDGIIEVAKEPYEEAYKIVQEQRENGHSIF